MQLNFLKNVVGEIVGKQETEIVNLLEGKKDVNEFLIAKKLKLTINQTRNILYKMSDNGLVSFNRKKDKRKGWYIYFWTLDVNRALEILEKKISEEIKQLELQLKNRKTKRFYFCQTCNVEVSEESALLNNFVCQECGQVYKLSEGDAVVKDLEAKINRLQKRLEVIRHERAELLEKEQKIRAKAKPKKKNKAKKKKPAKNNKSKKTKPKAKKKKKR